MRKDRSKKANTIGFATAAVLGIAAVGIASLAAYNQTLTRLVPTEDDSNSSQSTWVFTTSAPSHEADSPANKPENNILMESDKQIQPTEPTTASANTDNAAEAEEVNKPVVSTARNIMPVEGEVSHPFSNGELVKSETLGVWKTHDGCDILCPYDTDVKSMSECVVQEIKEDPLLGVCVITAQTNGLEVHYCGLAKELNVKVGQELKEGEILGKTSDTCQSEIVQEPHIHLAVKQNGIWIDPMSVITR